MEQINPNKNKRNIALIAGATGLTGSFLLNSLLADNYWDEVRVLARKESEIQHNKLVWVQTDFFKPELWEHYLKNVFCVFCTIGTIQSKTPDKELYKAIDYGIPVSLAKAASLHQVPKLIIVSSIGASQKSNFSYLKIKGQMESDVNDCSIETVVFLRPSVVSGNRKELRAGEKFSSFFLNLFQPFIPYNYRAITGKQLAEYMHLIAKKNLEKGRHVFHLKEMNNFQ